MPTTTDKDQAILSALKRNHFFYGKLMDVDQFKKEQSYGMQKSALMNRLVLGYGVLCGLDVIRDPESEDRIIILPGIAIDRVGREIVNPDAVSIDPHQLTDNEGQPNGEPIESGLIEICLAYKEIKTDPIPVMVPDCDSSENNCAYSTIKEGFCILLRNVEGDPPVPPSCMPGELPLPANGDLHQLICQQISEPCSEIGEETCVPLARVEWPLNDQSVDPCTARKLVYSNALLYELSLCMMDKIDQVAQGRNLRYNNGDGQIGSIGEQLDGSLIIEIIDVEGQPIKDTLVQFEVLSGGGNVVPKTTRTRDDGSAHTEWTLGDVVGEQQVVASAVGTPFTVTFRAIAQG